MWGTLRDKDNERNEWKWLYKKIIWVEYEGNEGKDVATLLEFFLQKNLKENWDCTDKENVSLS